MYRHTYTFLTLFLLLCVMSIQWEKIAVIPKVRNLVQKLKLSRKAVSLPQSKEIKSYQHQRSALDNEEVPGADSSDEEKRGKLNVILKNVKKMITKNVFKEKKVLTDIRRKFFWSKTTTTRKRTRKTTRRTTTTPKPFRGWANVVKGKVPHRHRLVLAGYDQGEDMYMTKVFVARVHWWTGDRYLVFPGSYREGFNCVYVVYYNRTYCIRDFQVLVGPGYSWVKTDVLHGGQDFHPDYVKGLVWYEYTTKRTGGGWFGGGHITKQLYGYPLAICRMLEEKGHTVVGYSFGGRCEGDSRGFAVYNGKFDILIDMVNN